MFQFAQIPLNMQDAEVDTDFQILTDGLTKAKPEGIISPCDVESKLTEAQLKMDSLTLLTAPNTELAHNECSLSIKLP
jgi:hypothetical protein